MSGATAPTGAPRPGTRPARTGTRSSTRSTARTPPRPAVRTAPSLRLVSPTQPRIARGPFLAVVLGVLGAGLLGLLGLNTVLAQNSFTIHAMQADSKELAVREQVLRGQVDDLQAPAALAAQAQAQGLVPGGAPAFLQLPDGTILGEPVPATAPPAPPAPAPPAAPEPAPAAPAGGVPAAPGDGAQGTDGAAADGGTAGADTTNSDEATASAGTTGADTTATSTESDR